MMNLTSTTISISIGSTLLAISVGTFLGIRAGKGMRGVLAGSVLGFTLSYLILTKNLRSAMPALRKALWSMLVTGIVFGLDMAVDWGNGDDINRKKKSDELYFALFESFAWAFSLSTFNPSGGAIAGGLAIGAVQTFIQGFADYLDAPDHETGVNNWIIDLFMDAVVAVITYLSQNVIAAVANRLPGPLKREILSKSFRVLGVGTEAVLDRTSEILRRVGEKFFYKILKELIPS